jgi:SulP family sulfate permease
MWTRIFPFFGWFKRYTLSDLQRDGIGGLTVALVLVPQSMAYAQLAGLPAYYGLYASFLPPMVAALFGSSRQLATGPVAVVSLMTATALEPLATAGSGSFIAYAVLLALLVGVFQFALGILRLGLVVNFLSHPVVSGFTNAAALIIASSQLSKLFGVNVDSAEHHYETVYNVFKAALFYTHWPTVGMAVLAFAIMIFLKRTYPRVPNVLVAVVITTALSWALGFECRERTDLAHMESPEFRERIAEFNLTLQIIEEISADRVRQSARLKDIEDQHGTHSAEFLQQRLKVETTSLKIEELKDEVYEHRARLRRMRFKKVIGAREDTLFYLRDQVPAGLKAEGRTWRLKIGNNPVDISSIPLSGGGDVVGVIPSGLPGIAFPKLNFSIMLSLFSMAIIISLLGFMEAISIAKAMAAKTGQRLDPNQELIGQGLANVVGSFSLSYPVSGSFSRSAVNLQAGAVSGLSNVFSSLVVVIVLLFFTPLLYHLPQAVLAAIIMMAVIGLVNVNTFIHAWKAQKYDGAIAIISFVCTLAFAPHLDRGIMIGVVLSIGLMLLRNIKPDIALLSRYTDGTYRMASRWGLELCKHIAVIRFNDALFFGNVAYLEEQVLDRVREMPELRHILLVGNGINELDASGEEALSILVDRLRESGVEISISGLNDYVLDVMRRTGLYNKIGENHLFRNATLAIAVIHEKAHYNTDETECPLIKPVFKGLPVATAVKRKSVMGRLGKGKNASSERQNPPSDSTTPQK